MVGPARRPRSSEPVTDRRTASGPTGRATIGDEGWTSRGHFPGQSRRVPWAKSKTECRRRRRRSPRKGRPAAALERPLRPVPGQPGADRPVQADAGLVRPALHRARPGRDRRPLGVWRLYEIARSSTRRSGPVRHPGGRSALVLGWVIFRIVQYPAVRRVPDRHRSRDEQGLVDQHATTSTGRPSVVLATVVLMAVFLFGVDWLWSNLLQLIGVLKFSGGGAFGSTG